MPIRVLCIGAHPDDNESAIGGTIALYRNRGDEVTMVSVTNGNKGHYEERYMRNPALLAARREQESLRAAAMVGARYECMGVPDGEVYVTPELTEALVRLMRRERPDVVLINRPWDYHRDHRYAAQAVLDASYMLTVPLMCPDTPHLSAMPVIACWEDDFTDPRPFQADVAVPIDAVLETKVGMVCCHESQFFEWIPFNAGSHEAFRAFPRDPMARRERVTAWYRAKARRIRAVHGTHLPQSVECAEAFQISEYGRVPAQEEYPHLFPLG